MDYWIDSDICCTPSEFLLQAHCAIINMRSQAYKKRLMKKENINKESMKLSKASNKQGTCVYRNLKWLCLRLTCWATPCSLAQMMQRLVRWLFLSSRGVAAIERLWQLGKMYSFMQSFTTYVSCDHVSACVSSCLSFRKQPGTSLNLIKRNISRASRSGKNTAVYSCGATWWDVWREVLQVTVFCQGHAAVPNWTLGSFAWKRRFTICPKVSRKEWNINQSPRFCHSSPRHKTTVFTGRKTRCHYWPLKLLLQGYRIQGSGLLFWVVTLKLFPRLVSKNSQVF